MIILRLHLKIFIFLFFIFVMSCNSKVEVQQKTTPQTLATESEQAVITQTVEEIQRLADELQLNMNFKDFPIVVVAEDTRNRNALAYCEYKSSGGGQYIAILKSTLTEYQLLYKAHGQNTFLFMVLVHEFGHCFYGRSHSDQVVQNNNGEFVPTTAMVTKSPNQLGMKVLPIGTKLFYLSEISGQNTAQNLPVF